MRSADNFNAEGRFKKTNWEKDQTPVHWFHGNPYLTYLSNIYIVVIAEIEDFIIYAIKSSLDKVEDKKLKRELESLVREEVAHIYQHTSVTNDLMRHNYPVKLLKKISKLFFLVCSKLMGQKSKIALALSMEFVAHQLAIIGLKNNFYPKNKLSIYDFLWWHSVEELPHINLAFELYKEFKGGYFRRIGSLILFSIFVVLLVTLFLFPFYITDKLHGRTVKLKTLIPAFAFVLGSRGVIWGRVKPFCSFFLPNYWPSIQNNDRDKMIKDLQTVSKGSLPYIDYILSNQSGKNSPLEKPLTEHVHWGYWDEPNKAPCCHEDYYVAACNLTKEICSTAKITHQQSVLDVGCGFGGTISHINDEFTDMNLCGLNIDDRQILRAKAKVKEANKNKVRFIEGNACQLPFETAQFDNILAVQSIFHFPSRNDFLQEACRVLKPGGNITISDFIPHPTILPMCWMVQFKPLQKYSFFGACNFSFTLKKYKKLAKQYDLDIEVYDISRNTLPTYNYLNYLVKIEPIKKQYQCIASLFLLSMRFLTWTRLFGYKIIVLTKKDRC